MNRPAHNPWKTAVLAGMASYLDAAVLVTAGIALVLYRPALGISDVELGLLSSLLTFAFAIGALLGGRLGDRFGRRRVYTVTLLGLVAATAVLALAVNSAMLFAGVVVAGFAIGADLPVSLALIAEEAPEGRQGKFVAFSAILWLIGIYGSTGMSAAVGGLGADGGRIMFGLITVVALVVLVLRMTMPESPEWTAAKTAARHANRDGERIDLESLRRLLRPPFVLAVAATALFYTVWVIASNTIGQFSTFLFVRLADVSVQATGLFKLVNIPIGLLCGWLFMRAVDTRRRYPWFVFGAVVQVVAFGTPLVFGPHLWTLLVMTYGFSMGAAFAGEALYKVWSQELYPTLLRATAQGTTIAVARVIAAVVAIFIPALATRNPTALFALVTSCVAASSAVGLLWIRRLPKAESDATAASYARMTPWTSPES
ncbi:MFS transporter [Saccharopolyspora pogona]|uniref:MFS transporter n=1 Tax=Saccharopolyspora pogona TaxID=333966 RepID=UPI001685D056|nr:MFS transporter [Saccharopolyspora pogona]